MSNSSKLREAPLASLKANASPLSQGLIYAVLGWFILADLGFISLIRGLESHSGVIVVAAIVGAFAGITRARSWMRGGVLVLISLWLIVAFTPLATRLAQPLWVEQAPEAADAVVVLAGGFQTDNDFSLFTLERTVHGLELMQGKFAPRLIVSVGTPPSGAAKSLKARLNIPGSLISVGPAYNTHDEAVLVSQLARRKGWKKILLVTSPTHSRRAMLTFEKVGLKVISSPCRETAFDFENMNDPGGQLNIFAAALHEIVGLRIYRARGWA